MRDELTSVIVSKCDVYGDVAIEYSARCTNCLTKRIDRSETLAGAVIDHDEDHRATLIGHARSAVDCPHLFGSRCHHLSIMHAWSRRCSAASRSEQVTSTHDSQNARISARRRAPRNKLTSPPSGFNLPQRILSSVLLPQPLRPTSPTRSPGSMANVAPSRTVLAPRVIRRLDALTTGMGVEE